MFTTEDHFVDTFHQVAMLAAQEVARINANMMSAKELGEAVAQAYQAAINALESET